MEIWIKVQEFKLELHELNTILQHIWILKLEFVITYSRWAKAMYFAIKEGFR